MPLPPALEKLIWTKRFWTVYFDIRPDNEEPWDPEENVVCDISVGGGYNLSLSFHLKCLFERQLNFSSPSSSAKPVEVAVTGPHSFPYLLRWSELLLISRAAAAHDPTSFSHPGLVVLLLAPFTPHLRRRRRRRCRCGRLHVPLPRGLHAQGNQTGPHEHRPAQRRL